MSANDGELGSLREQIEFALSVTDAHAAMLERHLIALEAVAATRWPLRILAAARLCRSLRQSARHLPGSTFAQRRYEADAVELHAGDEPEGR